MAIKHFALYKLYFKSPLHISDCKDDYGTSLKSYSSDSMYAALTSTLAKMGSEIPSDGDLKCVISSLFPFYQSDSDSNPVYFFPKPLSYSIELSEPELMKKVKKVKWVDLSYFESIIKGNKTPTNECSNSIKGSYMTNQTIIEDFIHSDVSERVAVSRDGHDSKPFYMDRLYFRGESGLYFLADGDTSLIDKALPLLSLEGIGTDRNVGNGLFIFERTNIKINVPDNADYAVSLSVYIPDNKNQLDQLLTSDSTCYEIQKRGGWISTPPYNTLRKNSIYAFMPGSVFYKAETGFGSIVDLAPLGLVKHPVWRCGKMLVLPISL